MSEIKKCPFCGDPMRLSKNDKHTSLDVVTHEPVSECILRAQCFFVDIWNTRAPSPALDKLRELMPAVERILELDAKATQGRWKSKLNHAPYKCVFINEREHYSTLELKPEDADLIAEYRTLAPKLARALRIIEELKQ